MESKKELKERIVREFFGTRNGDQKLLVVSVGGTSAGKYLVDFFSTYRQEISQRLDCLILVLLGSRISQSSYHTETIESIRFLQFIPDTISLFKAADCVVCQAGASTMNEIVCVGTACVTVPISNHFEQESNARRFAKKYGFDVVNYSDITVNSLTEAVLRTLNAKNYTPASFSSNVEKAARLIMEIAENE